MLNGSKNGAQIQIYQQRSSVSNAGGLSLKSKNVMPAYHSDDSYEDDDDECHYSGADDKISRNASLPAEDIGEMS